MTLRVSEFGIVEYYKTPIASIFFHLHLRRLHTTRYLFGLLVYFVVAQ